MKDLVYSEELVGKIIENYDEKKIFDFLVDFQAFISKNEVNNVEAFYIFKLTLIFLREYEKMGKVKSLNIYVDNIKEDIVLENYVIIGKDYDLYLNIVDEFSSYLLNDYSFEKTEKIDIVNTEPAYILNKSGEKCSTLKEFEQLNKELDSLLNEINYSDLIKSHENDKYTETYILKDKQVKDLLDKELNKKKLKEAYEILENTKDLIKEKEKNIEQMRKNFNKISNEKDKEKSQIDINQLENDLVRYKEESSFFEKEINTLENNIKQTYQKKQLKQSSRYLENIEVLKYHEKNFIDIISLNLANKENKAIEEVKNNLIYIMNLYDKLENKRSNELEKELFDYTLINEAIEIIKLLEVIEDKPYDKYIALSDGALFQYDKNKKEFFASTIKKAELTRKAVFSSMLLTLSYFNESKGYLGATLGIKTPFLNEDSGNIYKELYGFIIKKNQVKNRISNLMEMKTVLVPMKKEEVLWSLKRKLEMEKMKGVELEKIEDFIVKDFKK